MTTPTAVIVLAAGAGTRMKSSLPKVVHPVVGRSMIGHALHAAAGTHPDHLVAVVRHQRELVAAEILRNNPDVIIADQDDIPGTGRAVQCALDELLRRGHSLSGTILVTYGDVPMLDADTLNALVRSHDERGATVSVLTTIVDDPTGYGRIIRDDASGDVCRIVEQKDASEAERQIREINAGIYAFDGEFLRDALMHVGTNNNQGEVYLTDVLAQAYQADRVTNGVVLDDQWMAQGCNDRVQLAELAAEMNRRICVGHMRAGVSIVDPSSTWIECDVRIDADTTIYPNTVLRGRTEIATGCEIGPGTTLTNVQVGPGCRVPAAWVSNTRLEGDTIVTPFTSIER